MSDTTSYVAGTTDLPLFEDTIGAMLDRAVSRWPEREALVSVEQGVRWTYEEFGRRVEQTASAEEVRGFCQGQIAHYKIPRYVHFVDVFPTTVTGKVQKFLMRQQMMQLLDLAEQSTA